jgi:hypothetical protein
MARLIETVDLRQQDTARLGILRNMFPQFAEDIELGRYLRRLLSSGGYAIVHVEPHRDAEGITVPAVFDIYANTSVQLDG